MMIINNDNRLQFVAIGQNQSLLRKTNMKHRGAIMILANFAPVNSCKKSAWMLGRPMYVGFFTEQAFPVVINAAGWAL